MDHLSPFGDKLLGKFVPHTGLLTIGIVVGFLVLLALAVQYLQSPSVGFSDKFFLTPYIKFAYACFFKAHSKRGDGGQQSALESFYSAQASIYDATRKRLLCGREDMLGCIAAQLHMPSRKPVGRKPVWFDIGGGTGYNIEAMDQLVGIQEFFEHVYLVDLSTSLCEIARERVKKFGWTNVTILCQDARTIHSHGKTADLITMSYSLSMIPDFYSVVDQIQILLAPKGIIGICDFYVQSIVDVSCRNWTGGNLDRHVNWVGRMFWRTWFDADRVNLDAGRRDYVEYKFGTILSASERNYVLGGIPYYLFIGCHVNADTSRYVGAPSTPTGATTAQDSLEKLDAALTESPYMAPQDYGSRPQIVVRSKSYETALTNMSSNLPLPSTFYQHHPWRTTYPDLAPKHTQFASDYIYAFNWEDPVVDCEYLKLTPNDVLVTITSAGDNILDYLSHSPPLRIHAIDLNPNQNHLLELKAACYAAQLTHSQIFSLFGEGTYPDFRSLLVNRLSPHLSSPAFQFWLSHGNHHFSPTGRGMYSVSGGSRHAINLIRWLFKLTGLTQKVGTICSVTTLAEQKEIWYTALRKVLLSYPLHKLLISSEWWAWKAAGVPPEQRQLIVDDYSASLTAEQRRTTSAKRMGGEAIFRFLVDTLDPVINTTLLSSDNYFYHMVLTGKYTKNCAPRYLGQREHRRLSRENAKIFDNLRIHTDEFIEVVKRMRYGSVGAMILMDSMDWFTIPETKAVRFDDKMPKTKTERARSQSKSRSTEGSDAASSQIHAIHNVLRVGGRVLLRSAALRPWYMDVFERMEDEETGKPLWNVKCMGRRDSGKCIDRVNMYASCWLCTKVGEVTPTPSNAGSVVGSPRMPIKSAMRRRRTLSYESDGSASASGSEYGMSPEALRGRTMEITEANLAEVLNREKRGLMEDILLPGAALDEDGPVADRF